MKKFEIVLLFFWVFISLLNNNFFFKREGELCSVFILYIDFLVVEMILFEWVWF